jgi:hypothetical protein
MFPDFEETFTTKQFADFIGAHYCAARRLLIRFGGYRVIGNGNPNYEPRRVPRSRAEEIRRAITKPKKEGGRK